MTVPVAEGAKAPAEIFTELSRAVIFAATAASPTRALRGTPRSLAMRVTSG